MNPTLHSFAYCLDFLRDQVADVSAADMVAHPKGIVNHPAWIIGHLTYVFEMLGGAIGLPPWLPQEWAGRYGPGSVPVTDSAAYPTKENFLAILHDAQSRLTRAVEALPEARMDEPFPDESYRDVFPTIRHALTQVLVGHTAYHIGQITVWRSAMGLPGLGRSFE
ncbi:DinB family protein [Fontivita pretiosa]|uniref:DinB family protein n=1 Tax=Fontivita pretiosa TaxID=2989684 RepID=UPI003D162B58